ncbi:hypothetical protein [Yinghuangia soli]|uniref:Uncharacterized protein n=1 Tax=Yinghuangia soli TaxID=2908204 RepID=A0AA41PW27_9ACTN|nr:hypothetical protein [Yinghuangia soli]MCF2526939.1 hypothetical protein [Yinghuangia soli]
MGTSSKPPGQGRGKGARRRFALEQSLERARKAAGGGPASADATWALAVALGRALDGATGRDDAHGAAAVSRVLVEVLDKLNAFPAPRGEGEDDQAELFAQLAAELG